MSNNIETPPTNKKHKIDRAQEEATERLIESEIPILREKLHEAFAKSFSGRKREFSVEFNVIVKES